MDGHLHKKITKEAIEIIHTKGILTECHLSIILKANLTSDYYQKNSSIHFDNCSFRQGIERIHHFYISYKYQVNRLSKKSLWSLGKILHSVQDFYSHSNWIEIHQGYKLIPTWDLDLKKLPKGIESGFYEEGSINNCAVDTVHHDILNKDNCISKTGGMTVTKGPNADKTFFELSYSGALKASINEINKFFENITFQEITIYFTDSLPKIAESTLSICVKRKNRKYFDEFVLDVFDEFKNNHTIKTIWGIEKTNFDDIDYVSLRVRNTILDLSNLFESILRIEFRDYFSAHKTVFLPNTNSEKINNKKFIKLIKSQL